MAKQVIWQALYSYIVLPFLYITLKVVALKNKKLQETLHGHKGLWERAKVQISARDNNKILIWFHVASAGEYLQALPVMERLMQNGMQCALTVTSISGIRWAQKQKEQYQNLIFLDYLPLDTKKNMDRLINLINPNALVFVKFDLWPNLIWQAKQHNIPQLLISATLHEKSKRLTSFIARAFYQSLYSSINKILAVTKDDKERFLKTAPNIIFIFL